MVWSRKKEMKPEVKKPVQQLPELAMTTAMQLKETDAENFRSSTFRRKLAYDGNQSEEYVEAYLNKHEGWVVTKVTSYDGLFLENEGPARKPELEPGASSAKTTSIRVLKEGICFFEALHHVATFEMTQPSLSESGDQEIIAPDDNRKYYKTVARQADIIFNSQGLPCLTANFRPVNQDDFPDSEIQFLERRREANDEKKQKDREAAAEAKRQALEAEELKKKQKELEDERRLKLPVAIAWQDESLSRLFSVQASPDSSAELLRQAVTYSKCAIILDLLAKQIHANVHKYHHIREERDGYDYYKIKRIPEWRRWDKVGLQAHTEFAAASDEIEAHLENVAKLAQSDPDISHAARMLRLNFAMLQAAWYFDAVRVSKNTLEHLHGRLDSSTEKFESYMRAQDIDNELAAKARSFVVIPRKMSELGAIFTKFSEDVAANAEKCRTASENIAKLMQYGPDPVLDAASDPLFSTVKNPPAP